MNDFHSVPLAQIQRDYAFMLSLCHGTGSVRYARGEDVYRKYSASEVARAPAGDLLKSRRGLTPIAVMR